MNDQVTIVLSKQELQATLALFDLAIKAAGLSPQTENAVVLARKFAAAAEPPKPDLEATAFAQANTE